MTDAGIIIGIVLLGMCAVAALVYPRARKALAILGGGIVGGVLALVGMRRHRRLPAPEDPIGMEEPTDPSEPPPIEPPTHDYTRGIPDAPKVDGTVYRDRDTDRTDEQRAREALDWWGVTHNAD